MTVRELRELLFRVHNQEAEITINESAIEGLTYEYAENGWDETRVVGRTYR